ncbi:MAG: hypothetical protein H0V80_00500, partial [Acidobacteria bacterium]|nr:hypothetical protein [Acidobacteriota bacterium]
MSAGGRQRQRLHWCSVVVAILSTGAYAASRQANVPRGSRTDTGQARPALSPDEALTRFVVEPGYRIDLIAAEPLVQSPVAIAFDERGRLYVV